jgi:hypothetical protein
MAYQKLQAREALNIIPNDDVRIPDSSSAIVVDTSTGATRGVADFSVLNTLTDVGTSFTTAGIPPGAIVYNPTANIAYYVVSVDSDTQLTLSGGAAGGATDSYTIYARATIGCTLFIGGAGDVNVRMAEQNGNTTSAPLAQYVRFKGLGAASFMPIQVVQVKATLTTATDIIALW